MKDMKISQVEELGIVELSQTDSLNINGGLFNSLSGEYNAFKFGTYLGKNLASFVRHIGKGFIEELTKLQSS